MASYSYFKKEARNCKGDTVGVVYENRWLNIYSYDEIIDMEQQDNPAPLPRKARITSSVFFKRDTPNGVFINANMEIVVLKGCRPYVRIINHEGFTSEKVYYNTVRYISEYSVHLFDRKIEMRESNFLEKLERLHFKELTPLNNREIIHYEKPLSNGQLHNGFTKEEAIAYLRSQYSKYTDSQRKLAKYSLEYDARMREKADLLRQDALEFIECEPYTITYQEEQMYEAGDSIYFPEYAGKQQQSFLIKIDGIDTPVIFIGAFVMAYKNVCINGEPLSRFAVAVGVVVSGITATDKDFKVFAKKGNDLYRIRLFHAPNGDDGTSYRVFRSY